MAPELESSSKIVTITQSEPRMTLSSEPEAV